MPMAQLPSTGTERLHWAAWMRCPTCRERFALVDDCEACAGQGLVPAPVPGPGW